VVQAHVRRPARGAKENPVKIARNFALVAALVSGLLTGVLPALAVEPKAGPENRGSFTIRDQSGRSTERWESGPSDTLVRRDATGRRLGTVEPTPWGDYVIRDNRGSRVGTIERSR
jgi:hypothetical protein